LQQTLPEFTLVRAQRVVVVALDDEVLPRRLAMAQGFVLIEDDEIVVDRGFGVELVAFPHQPELALRIAPLQQANQRVAIEMCVLPHAALSDNRKTQPDYSMITSVRRRVWSPPTDSG